MAVNFAEAAQGFRARGWHVIPARPRDKRPAVPSWREFQADPPDADQIAVWWDKNPDFNVALVTGRGLVVVDLDGRGAKGLLAEHGIEIPDGAGWAETGNGWHVYLATPPGVVIGNKAAILRGSAVDPATGKPPQVDVRGDGGYVIAPPSIHPNGRPYRWHVEPGDELPQIPAKLLELCQPRPAATKVTTPVDAASQAAPAKTDAGAGQGWVTKALQGVGEGMRDDTCAKLAGYLVPKLPHDVVWSMLKDFAAKCRPPLPEQDAWRVLKSIRQKHLSAGGKTPDEDGQASAGRREPTLQHISEALIAVVEEFGKGELAFIRTPFPGVNELLVGGFAGGDLVVLGGRPGLGKTALALELTRCAARDGRRTVICSREMKAVALARRAISQEGRIEAASLKLGTADMGRMEQTIERLGKLPIWITDDTVTVPELGALLRLMPEPPEFIVVDYLQLMRSGSRSRPDRRAEVDEVTWALKVLAGEFNCPLLVLSSLTRPKDGKAPTMASLRESGEIEHTASVVILLHRPENSRDQFTDAIVAKGRDGQVGTVKLIFRDVFVSFDELAAEYADDYE